MKTKLSILGALLVLILACLLDTPASGLERSWYYQFSNEDTVDADAQPDKKSAATTYEYILEDMKEEEDYIMETYREYEIHKDKEGNVIIRIPTSNYNYLRYEK
jgi:hypothetical protein